MDGERMLNETKYYINQVLESKTRLSLKDQSEDVKLFANVERYPMQFIKHISWYFLWGTLGLDRWCGEGWKEAICHFIREVRV